MRTDLSSGSSVLVVVLLTPGRFFNALPDLLLVEEFFSSSSARLSFGNSSLLIHLRSANIVKFVVTATRHDNFIADDDSLWWCRLEILCRAIVSLQVTIAVVATSDIQFVPIVSAIIVAGNGQVSLTRGLVTLGRASDDKFALICSIIAPSILAPGFFFHSISSDDQLSFGRSWIFSAVVSSRRLFDIDFAANYSCFLNSFGRSYSAAATKGGAVVIFSFHDIAFDGGVAASLVATTGRGDGCSRIIEAVALTIPVNDGAHVVIGGGLTSRVVL